VSARAKARGLEYDDRVVVCWRKVGVRAVARGVKDSHFVTVVAVLDVGLGAGLRCQARRGWLCPVAAIRQK
jgi:hypothetical protein